MNLDKVNNEIRNILCQYGQEIPSNLDSFSETEKTQALFQKMTTLLSSSYTTASFLWSFLKKIEPLMQDDVELRERFDGITNTAKSCLQGQPSSWNLKEIPEKMLLSAMEDEHTSILEVFCDMPFKDSIVIKGQPLLLYAAQKGFSSAIEILLRRGANVDLRNSRKSTPLMIAANKGHTEVVKVLLQYNADPTLTNEGGSTALMAAAESGHDKIVEDLLKCGLNKYNLNLAGPQGCTALILAAQNGHVAVVEALIEANVNVDLRNEEGLTALMIAALDGDVEIVKVLLRCRADPEIYNQQGDTALILAAQNGHLAVVEALIEAKVNINLQNKEEFTALMIAAHYGDVEVVKALIAADNVDVNLQNEGNTALIVAVQKGHVAVVKALVEANNINVNLQNEEGNTALILAAHDGNVEVVTALIAANNVDVNLQNESNTALMVAAHEGHAKVVTALIEANNVNVDLKNKEEFTAFILAVYNGHDEVVKVFLDHNENPNLDAIKGYSPLLIAAQQGHAKVVETLIERNADPNFVTRQDFTALMLAAEKGHVEVVKVLIAAKVDVNRQNKDGVTALMVAVARGQPEVVETLLEYGANSDLADLVGLTALMRAARNGAANIVKQLLVAGANINLRRQDDLVAFDFAINQGNKDAAKVLLDHELTQNPLAVAKSLALHSKEERDLATHLARHILLYYIRCEPDEDHPLLQEALATLLYLQVEKEDSCYIHALMKKNKMAFTDIESTISPVRVKECKALITMDLNGLREGVKASSKTHETLQSEIIKFNTEHPTLSPPLGPDVFEQLFAQLIDRIEKKKDTASPENIAELDSYLDEIKLVKKRFLKENGFIHTALHEKLEDDTLISPLMERLYGIAIFLLQTENTEEPGKILSPRDKLMMTYLPMIENCRAGQTTGSTLCYNALRRIVSPDTPQIADIEEEASRQAYLQDAKHYLQHNVQQVMEYIIRSPDILHYLAISNIEQLDPHHQSTYLRNLLGKECGLNHQETLDISGGYISRDLLMESRENILRFFFYDLSCKLPSGLKEDFNSLDLTLRTKRYNELMTFLEGTDPYLLEQIWSYGATGIELTDFGALFLLEKAGYIQMEGLQAYHHYASCKNSLEESKSVRGENQTKKLGHDLRAAERSLEEIPLSSLAFFQPHRPSFPGILPGDIQELADQIQAIEAQIQALSIQTTPQENLAQLQERLRQLREEYEKAHQICFPS